MLSILTRLVSGTRDSGAPTDGGVSADGANAGDSGGIRGWFHRQSDFVSSAPFWLPPFLLMAFAVYGAIIWNFVISLTDMSGYGDPNYSNLDFQNYVDAFTKGGLPPIWSQLQNTIVLLVVFTVLCLVVGLLLAILLDRQLRFKGAFRNIYLLPMSLSFVVTAQFWLWMYNYDSGFVNETLRWFGITNPPHWIGDPQFSLAAIIFALIWQFSGYAMVVYLAGLQAIPDDQFEAARMDGASTVKMYWRVILPQLRSSTVGAAVVLMVFALKAFDFLYSITGGFTPPAGTDILATMMVRQAFGSLHWAYGATIAVILFVLALVVIGPYLAVQYRRGSL